MEYREFGDVVNRWMICRRQKLLMRRHKVEGQNSSNVNCATTWTGHEVRGPSTLPQTLLEPTNSLSLL
eukprot:500160-Amphidinium_carterae.1